MKELYETRNFQGGLKYGLLFGLVHGFVVNILKGKEFWNLIPKLKDSQYFKKSKTQKVIDYSGNKKDGKLTFDILENLSRSGTNHEHDQPSHLVVKDKTKPVISLKEYSAPEERFCPARVYEFIESTNDKGEVEKHFKSMHKTVFIASAAP